ncbi:GatB/YqeY domain-containing protein [Nocardioides lentus]|uniref:GatB/YqeY domain-containing protein n=2 Tax=Nocardioides lentus TaxID=338077 RepID=A0ABP5AGP0_9ACTN
MGGMSALKDRLRTDLTAAMKAREELRASTLRMALTAITNAEVAGKSAKELSDAEVVDVLSSEAKRRREAATAFDEGDRPERAERERAEAGVLADYLPTPLTDEEVAAIVADAVVEAGAEGQGMKAMGRVMGLVAPRTKGRADGGVVAAEVKRQLA